MLRLETLEDRTVLSSYQQINLVGELPGMAPKTDPYLDGWGMDNAPNGAFMVADAPFGKVTSYDASGNVLPQSVTVPPPPSQPFGPVGHPRGIVYNPTSEFVISEGGRSAPALFLICSREGAISGWNPAVDPNHAIMQVDNSGESPKGAAYSGMVIAKNSHGQNVLYVADRANNKIDMFDGSLHFLGSFTDPSVATEFSGTNPGAWQIEEVNGRLFVTFTLGIGPSGNIPRSAGGVVDVFDTDGNLLTPKHFAANEPGAGPLQDPWAIVQAPANFGEFSNDILVGNVEGGGNINAFDPATGEFIGPLTRPDDSAISIPGLWDMTFGGGNPINGQTNELYFDAGPTLGQQTGLGLFGKIIATGEDEGRHDTDNIVAGFDAVRGFLRFSPNGMSDATTLAPIVLSPPFTLPASLPSGLSALTGIGVTATRRSQLTSIDKDTPSESPARKLFFAQLDSDLNAGDANILY